MLSYERGFNLSAKRLNSDIGVSESAISLYILSELITSLSHLSSI